MSQKFIFDKKNILVIGGAGFIGSHLCEKLLEDYKVICVDNFSSGTERNIDHLLADANFKFIKYDMVKPLVLEDYSELADFRIEFQGVQEIYNLACPTSPKNFEKNRIANLIANSYVLKNGLDLALRYQAKFLHFSSSVVYGGRLDDNHRVSEEEIGLIDMLSQRCSYDEGKRFAESMVKTYRDVYSLDTKIIRLFRTFGPRMPLGEGHMIPDFIEAALEDAEILIHGDSSFSSSYCYVKDVVSGAIKMMDSDCQDPINIGSDINLNIVDIAKKIIAMLESESQISFGDSLLFMSPLSLPNISKARQLLSWMPLTTLENGLQSTIDDLRASKGLKSVKYY